MFCDWCHSENSKWLFAFIGQQLGILTVFTYLTISPSFCLPGVSIQCPNCNDSFKKPWRLFQNVVYVKAEVAQLIPNCLGSPSLSSTPTTELLWRIHLRLACQKLKMYKKISSNSFYQSVFRFSFQEKRKMNFPVWGKISADTWAKHILTQLLPQFFILRVLFFFPGGHQGVNAST